MAPGEAPKILGSSFEHSRKISRFLTLWPFLARIYIGSAGADLRHGPKFQILFSGVPKGGVGWVGLAPSESSDGMGRTHAGTVVSQRSLSKYSATVTASCHSA